MIIERPSNEIIQNLEQELELKKSKLQLFIEQKKDPIIIQHLLENIKAIECFLSTKFPLYI